jgi:hypothetical protein
MVESREVLMDEKEGRRRREKEDYIDIWRARRAKKWTASSAATRSTCSPSVTAITPS